MANWLIKTGFAFALVLCTVPAWAQGTIVIEHPIPLPRPIIHPVLAVRDHHVKTSIVNQVATTSIKQVYRNPSRSDLEGVYIFAVPANASISDFSMWMNGRKVSGELVEAKRARRIYEDIVRRLKDPGLLEYLGRDLFRARVYPIPAHGDVAVEIVYSEILKLDSGLVTYRYPLSCRAGQVYRSPPPGQGRRHRDAPSRWGDFSIEVAIESNTPIKNLYSPNYDIAREVRGNEARCSFEEDNFRPASDFLLYYMLSESDVGMSLLTHRWRGRDGHFMLMLSPGQIDRPTRVLSKDVIFVIDRSGSMRGDKIEQAKEALRYCLNSLNPKDRFQIVTFATDVKAFERGLTRATKPALRDAEEFVDEITARGGTDIDGALRVALGVDASRRPQFMIFLTDGEPTVGETDIYKILENVARRNDDGVRLFVFGVGYDVNTHLLDRISAENRGAVEYVRPDEDIEVKVSNFYAKVSEPVFSELEVDFGAVRVYDVFPRELPDLFSGGQLVILGRYRKHGPATIRVSGRVDDGEREIVHEGRFARRERDNDFIGPLWASRKIAYLIDQIRRSGENRELVDEVIELSTDYGIVTPYTSYLILEDERPGWLSGVVRERHLRFSQDAADIDMALKTQAGRAAVSLSQRLGEAKKEEVLDRPATPDIVFVAGKTFYETADGWIDADYEEDVPTVEVAFLSDEYFDLISKHPDLARYLSLGSRIVVVYDGTAYKITA